MSSKHILIVEDEAYTAVMLLRVLNDHLGEGCQAHICPLADVALFRLQREPFDLIVTDICMPGMSGLELVYQVRQISPQTPILVITAYGSPELMERVQQLGADYLLKPFELREFVTTVERILDKAEQEHVEHRGAVSKRTTGTPSAQGNNDRCQ